jgi:hypothetical protein
MNKDRRGIVCYKGADKWQIRTGQSSTLHQVLHGRRRYLRQKSSEGYETKLMLPKERRMMPLEPPALTPAMLWVEAAAVLVVVAAG